MHPDTAARLKRSVSLTTELVQAFGDRVRDGTWKAGAKLPKEADLIEEFGVSRTVVREALREGGTPRKAAARRCGGAMESPPAPDPSQSAAAKPQQGNGQRRF